MGAFHTIQIGSENRMSFVSKGSYSRKVYGSRILDNKGGKSYNRRQKERVGDRSLNAKEPDKYEGRSGQTDKEISQSG